MPVIPATPWYLQSTNPYADQNYMTSARPSVGGEVITGTGFGTNTATQHLSSDWVKVQAIGDAPEINGWEWEAPTYVQVYNDSTRGKVLKGSSAAIGPFNNIRGFDYGSAIPVNTPVFTSHLTKLETDATGSDSFQWKTFRFRSTLGWSDTGTEMAYFNWINTSDTSISVRPNADASGGTTLWTNEFPDINIWTRQEAIIDLGGQGTSDTDVHNGKYPLGLTPSFNSDTGVLALNTATRYRWFVWQNYLGNVTGTVNQRDYLGDDYYIQVGSLKRVILSNNLNPALATFTQIQKWTAWADTEITIDPNLNAVADGSYYLLVMTGSNTVIDSQAVTVTNEAFV